MMARRDGLMLLSLLLVEWCDTVSALIFREHVGREVVDGARRAVLFGMSAQGLEYSEIVVRFYITVTGHSALSWAGNVIHCQIGRLDVQQRQLDNRFAL